MVLLRDGVEVQPLDIFEGKNPTEGGDVPLQPDLVARVWSDYQPWREAASVETQGRSGGGGRADSFAFLQNRN
jgi:hypothetical protein